MKVEFPELPANIPVAMRKPLEILQALLILLIGVLAAAQTGAAPVIDSCFPTYGSAGDPSYINIYGSGFTPGPVTVKFNGTTATMGGVISDTHIQAAVPVGAPIGSESLYVSVNGVVAERSGIFTVIGPGPYISAFTPYGAPGNTITIFGAHFTASMTVFFNGKPVAAAAAVSTSFNVTVPAGVTTGPLTVSNSVGTWTSVSNFYAPPVITGFTPTNGRAGTVVVIQGTNFVGTSEVRFNGVTAPIFTVLSNNAIQVTVPANVTTGPIRIFTPADDPVTTNKFVVLPTIAGFNPTFGTPGTDVTLTGANLNEGAGAGGAPSVYFNGVQSSQVTGVSFGQLTAKVPNGATTGKISVTTTNGSGTNDMLFYLPPQITGFYPSNSLPGSTITISGVNFSGATAVSFNGTPAFSTVSNNTTIGAVVPAGFTTGPISVTTPAGVASSSSIANSNYYAVPFVAGFNPAFGLPGTNVTLSGSSFLGTFAVRFPAGGGGTTNAVSGPITVVAPAGSHTSAGSFFLQYPGLLVTVSASPDPVTVGSNLTYTIQVKNLGPFASVVTLTNTLPPGVSFVSASAGSTVSNVTRANLGSIAVNATASVSVVAKPSFSGLTITNQTQAVAGPAELYPPMLTTTYVEPLALLSISVYSPSEVLLTWPKTLSNYTLQYKNGFSAGLSWVDVLTPPATNANSYLISQPRSDPMRIFRLRK